MSGWIKVHRELMDKPIWKTTTPIQKSILFAILLSVNYAENVWSWNGQRFHLRAGQLVTSLPALAALAGKGVTVQNVRTALKLFEKLEFLTDQSTATGRIITVVNWQLYQHTADSSTGDSTDA